MKRAAPLLADRLPLYASDAELQAALFGARGKSVVWASLSKAPDFPRISHLLGGRFVPDVIRWFEAYEERMRQSSPDGVKTEVAQCIATKRVLTPRRA